MRWDQSYIFSEDDIPSVYEAGAEGVVYDPAEQEAFEGQVRDSGNSPVGEEIAHEYGFADEFKGKLVLPFIHFVDRYPTAWPGPAQRRGDCVSHACRSALAGTVLMESYLGIEDSESGKVEVAPDVSPEGESQGLFASEPIYWGRGKDSDGWFIGGAAKTALSTAGAVIRKDYPEISTDLTRYDPKIAGKWGRTPPPPEVVEVTNDNLFRTATTLRSTEEWRDFLGKGFFIGTDGSEGFSKTRDENGVARRRGSWAHSMSAISFDDRPETHRIYGCAAVLILNSWGSKWISGPRKIRGTDINIPEGSFWALTKDFNRRAVAFSGANGWARKSLPDLNPGFE